ncbi:MAG: hypothetical protein Q7S20_08790 [Gemmatimonadaceae bacterium]|nr:hypothetical protein [Gemmatimonadaceae bacterium]
MAEKREQEIALGSESLHQRGGGQAGFGADVGEGQMLGADPAECTESGVENRGVFYGTWTR